MDEDRAADPSASAAAALIGSLAELKKRLKKGQASLALDMVDALIGDAENLSATIGPIVRQFTKTQHARLLAGFLLDLPEARLARLAVVAALAELSAVPETGLSFDQLVERLDRRGVPERTRFQPADLLRRYQRLGPAAMALLVRCKYGTLDWDGREGFWSTVERAAERIAIPEPVLGFLDAARADPSAERPVWRRRLAAGFALDHVTHDYASVRLHDADKPTRRAALDVYVDDCEARAALARIDTEGALLLTFHGGLLRPALDIYDQYLPAGEILEGTRGDRDAKAGKTGQFGAGFLALKRLIAGGVVLMAPDGARGRAATSVQVAGVTLPLPEGGAFLAYESGCRTAWYSAERRGDRIAPVVRPGPRREAGEAFADFSRRFFDFYAAQIEAAIGGDPLSLSLRTRWLDYACYGGRWADQVRAGRAEEG